LCVAGTAKLSKVRASFTAPASSSASAATASETTSAAPVDEPAAAEVEREQDAEDVVATQAAKEAKFEGDGAANASVEGSDGDGAGDEEGDKV
jgi:hypothetical protein